MRDLPPLIGNPYNGYINPYYWVDDHPLLYGNNGSLDPSTNENKKPWTDDHSYSTQFSPSEGVLTPLASSSWLNKPLAFIEKQNHGIEHMCHGQARRYIGDGRPPTFNRESL